MYLFADSSSRARLSRNTCIVNGGRRTGSYSESTPQCKRSDAAYKRRAPH